MQENKIEKKRRQRASRRYWCQRGGNLVLGAMVLADVLCRLAWEDNSRCRHRGRHAFWQHLPVMHAGTLGCSV